MKRALFIFMFSLCFFLIGCNRYVAIPFNSISLGGSDTDMFHDLIIDSSGNYVAVGETRSGDYGIVDNSVGNDTDGLIVKYDAAGALLWQKTVGDEYFEQLNSIIEDDDGNYLVVGTKSNPMYVDSFFCGLMIKMDPEGNILWNHTTDTDVYRHFQSVIKNDAGNYVVVGQTFNEEENYLNPSISMYDTMGTLMWETLEDSSGIQMGQFDSLIENTDGNYVAVGYTYVLSTLNHLNSQALLATFDSDGQRLSAYTYGEDNGERFYSVTQGDDGNYVAVGFYNGNGIEFWTSFLESADAWITKIDPAGNALWSTTFGGSQADMLRSVQTDSDGRYVAAGFTASQDYDDTDRFHTPEENPFLTLDALITVFDNDGQWVNDELVGGLGGDIFEKIVIDKYGNYVTAGYSTSDDFDLVSNHGGFDGWIWVENKEPVKS